MAKVLFIVANNWYQDTEFWTTYKTLTAQWHNCEIASWKWWWCGWVFWTEIEDSKKIEDVNALDYDLLVFIWWGWAERQYHDNEKYLELAKSWKAVAAICIAPTILSYSWLFNWKEVTGRDNWEKTQIKQIEMNWWIFKYEEVVQDWKIITANWLEAATKFARKIVDFLKNLEN